VAKTQGSTSVAREKMHAAENATCSHPVKIYPGYTIRGADSGLRGSPFIRPAQRCTELPHALHESICQRLRRRVHPVGRCPGTGRRYPVSGSNFGSVTNLRLIYRSLQLHMKGGLTSASKPDCAAPGVGPEAWLAASRVASLSRHTVIEVAPRPCSSTPLPSAQFNPLIIGVNDFALYIVVQLPEAQRRAPI
jgi:hypothetical protein